MSRTVLVALCAAAGCVPPWTEHRSGPAHVQFPCAPRTQSAVTRCVARDGAEYSLAVVEKGLPDADELGRLAAEIRDDPALEPIDLKQFPARWRERRLTAVIERMLHYRHGTEYLFTVSYFMTSEPPELRQFFDRVRMED